MEEQTKNLFWHIPVMYIEELAGTSLAKEIVVIKKGVFPCGIPMILCKQV